MSDVMMKWCCVVCVVLMATIGLVHEVLIMFLLFGIRHATNNVERGERFGMLAVNSYLVR